MASQTHQNVNIHQNRENITSRIAAKTAAGTVKLQPLRRAALDDLGNRLNNIHNATEIKKGIMGPPAEIPKKKIDIKTKASNLNLQKENVIKTAKSNSTLTNSKIESRKPIRQESLIISKKPQQVAKQTTEVPKKPIVDQSKELTLYDPDENSRDDPYMVTEYIEDIMAYLRGLEDSFPIRIKFLEDTKVTPKMRTTLVNWLVDVHQSFSLCLETLHLCITIVDRYLQVNSSVDRRVYQLVGVSALLLACKMEEIYMPDISDFVCVCDNAFSKRQILQMEINIVKMLNFRLGWPMSIYFLRRYSKVAQVKSDQHTLAKYMLELALLEYKVAHVKPSLQAAAACCLSIAILSEIMDPSRIWTPTLVHYTTYKYGDFKLLLNDFAHMIVKAETTNKFDTVKQKYSSSKFGKISLNFKLKGPLVRKLTLSPT